MKQCDITPISPAQACDNAVFPQKEYILKGNKLYIDGSYFGYLIAQTSESFTVRCDNGNMYMQGKDFKIDFVS